MTTRKKPRPAVRHATVSAAYLFYIEELAQQFAVKFAREFSQKTRMSCDLWNDMAYLQPQPGEDLKEAIEKWLVRAILFQTNRQEALRAALQYRDLWRAQKLVRNNRNRANLPRPSAEVKDIEKILKSNPNLSWKQVFRQVNDSRVKEGKRPIADKGAKDRILNTRKRLREEITQVAAMRVADAELDGLENDSR